MHTRLSELKKFTNVVADTGNIDEIALYQPDDATTNPSLILAAAKLPIYATLIEQATQYAREKTSQSERLLTLATDKLAVSIGEQILTLIPGRISTEVDARLSFDTKGSIARAKQLIEMYQEVGIDSSRILIKLAATWQGIQAAKQLEQDGIQCNLTLLFSFAQARAAAEAGVYLISPFVGRVTDWYKAKEQREFSIDEDPGVIAVSNIYQYFKAYDYPTIIMGASFRTIEQVLALAGCDKLTISPALLAQLNTTNAPVTRQLQLPSSTKVTPSPLTEAEFLWQHHQDAMAVEKLAEGIRNFAVDQQKLEVLLREYL